MLYSEIWLNFWVYETSIDIKTHLISFCTNSPHTWPQCHLSNGEFSCLDVSLGSFANLPFYLSSQDKYKEKANLILIVIISPVTNQQERGVCVGGWRWQREHAISPLFAQLVISQTRCESPAMICPPVCLQDERLWVSQCSSVLMCACINAACIQLTGPLLSMCMWLCLCMSVMYVPMWMCVCVCAHFRIYICFLWHPPAVG